MNDCSKIDSIVCDCPIPKKRAFLKWHQLQQLVGTGARIQGIKFHHSSDPIPSLSDRRMGCADSPPLSRATPRFSARLAAFVERLNDCWIGDVIGCGCLFVILISFHFFGGLFIG